LDSRIETDNIRCFILLSGLQNLHGFQRERQRERERKKERERQRERKKER
jgi:hypothetical protein